MKQWIVLLTGLTGLSIMYISRITTGYPLVVILHVPGLYDVVYMIANLFTHLFTSLFTCLHDLMEK